MSDQPQRRHFEQASDPASVALRKARSKANKAYAARRKERGEQWGFSLMEPEALSEVSREGGQEAHRLGKAHTFTPEEARAANAKGKEARLRGFQRYCEQREWGRRFSPPEPAPPDPGTVGVWKPEPYLPPFVTKAAELFPPDPEKPEPPDPVRLEAHTRWP